MPQKQLKNLYEIYSKSVAYVAVLKSNENQDIGSCFHIGEGIFITARHVIENNRILDIGIESTSFLESGGTITGIYFHPDPQIDVAAITLDGIDAPSLPLGSHLDDCLNLIHSSYH